MASPGHNELNTFMTIHLLHWKLKDFVKMLLLSSQMTWQVVQICRKISLVKLSWINKNASNIHIYQTYTSELFMIYLFIFIYLFIHLFIYHAKTWHCTIICIPLLWYFPDINPQVIHRHAGSSLSGPPWDQHRKASLTASNARLTFHDCAISAKTTATVNSFPPVRWGSNFTSGFSS